MGNATTTTTTTTTTTGRHNGRPWRVVVHCADCCGGHCCRRRWSRCCWCRCRCRCRHRCMHSAARTGTTTNTSASATATAISISITPGVSPLPPSARCERRGAWCRTHDCVHTTAAASTTSTISTTSTTTTTTSMRGPTDASPHHCGTRLAAPHTRRGRHGDWSRRRGRR